MRRANRFTSQSKARLPGSRSLLNDLASPVGTSVPPRSTTSSSAGRRGRRASASREAIADRLRCRRPRQVQGSEQRVSSSSILAMPTYSTQRFDLRAQPSDGLDQVTLGFPARGAGLRGRQGRPDPVQFRHGDYRRQETFTLGIPVLRSGPAIGPASVDFSTSPGVATQSRARTTRLTTGGLSSSMPVIG